MSFLPLFFPNGHICAFIPSDVQSSCLPQFNIINPGCQLIWMKVSLPNISKFICTPCRSPVSTNHKLLFDYPVESVDTIILQPPCSEITILHDFNVYIPNWLTHSSLITSLDSHDAEAFGIVNALSQVISDSTYIPNRSEDKANMLNMFLTSNLDIYSNPGLVM